MKRNIRLLTFAVFFSLPTLAFADPGNGNQNGNGNGGNGNHYGWGNDPGNNGGNNVPLDGGLSLLAAAGIGYAAKRYTASKKETGK